MHHNEHTAGADRAAPEPMDWSRVIERVKDAPEARRAHGALADRMIAALKRSDPLAEQLLLDTRGTSRRQILDTLESLVLRGEQPDEAFGPLHAQWTHVPDWVDFDQLDRGAAFFMSTHAFGGTVLGAKSLVLGYASPAGNKPLMMSGRLEHGVTRRLAETSKFVYEVCRRGGMRPGGQGVAETLKVRLIHAKVRQMILASGQWQPQWGVPINQHDMVATILLFSLSLLEGLEVLGVRVRQQEARDYIALWRYIGYIIGVEPELLPTSLEHAREVFAFIEQTQHEPDDDARRLTKIFLKGPDADDTQVRAPEMGRRAAITIAREMLGQARASALGVPEERIPGVMFAFKRAVRAFDALRRSPLAGSRFADRGERYWAWVLETNPVGMVELGLPDALWSAPR